MQSILSELKAQKSSVEPSCRHALCRVYVGLCRQLGDLERARLFCYSLLKEGAPGAVGAVCGCGVWRLRPCQLSGKILFKARQVDGDQGPGGWARQDQFTCLSRLDPPSGANFRAVWEMQVSKFTAMCGPRLTPY